jgi:hypothetical protein
MGLLIGCQLSATILLFNIVVVIVVAAKTGFKGDTAELPFFYDSPKMCVLTRSAYILGGLLIARPIRRSQISSGIHILINALSTILLAASNYTMQVLTS